MLVAMTFPLSDADLFQKPTGAANRGDQAAHQRRGHLAQRRVHSALGRRHDAGTERRAVAQPALHSARRPTDPERHCAHSAARCGSLSTVHLSLVRPVDLHHRLGRDQSEQRSCGALAARVAQLNTGPGSCNDPLLRRSTAERAWGALGARGGLY